MKKHFMFFGQDAGTTGIPTRNPLLVQNPPYSE
jgi:hypothetical protein